MNLPEGNQPALFAGERLERARRAAASGGVRLVEGLEEDSGLQPEQFVAALAGRFGLPALRVNN